MQVCYLVTNPQTDKQYDKFVRMLFKRACFIQFKSSHNTEQFPVLKVIKNDISLK